MKLHLVWNESKSECVGFIDIEDAEYASSGQRVELGVSTLAEAFRDTYADDDPDAQFEMTEIEI